MMTKIIIPSLMVATILVAGIFAFMPVEQASTVHTILQDTTGTWQTDSLTYTTATSGAAVAADFSITVDADGPFAINGIYVYWDDATLDENNDDSETITTTTCTVNDDQDDDVVYDITDVVLGGDDDAGDIIEQDLFEIMNLPTDAEAIVIDASDSFDCTMALDTDGTDTDGFIFTVFVTGFGPGDIDVTSTDSTP